MVLKFVKLIPKNLKLIFLSLFLIIFSVTVFSQNGLHIPLEFQKAFDKGTRSVDGNPGNNYWQNHSNYKIEADFNTSTRTLNGKENITYYNESPNFIDYLLIRLYQDINRPENAKDWNYNKESFSNGVKINLIKVNGDLIDIENQTEKSGTNLKIRYSVNSGTKVDVYIEWSIEFPLGRSPRMGRYDSTTYMIAYWYPQMAVYDDIDGWDLIDYTGQVEFYNDFSDFDVTLSIDNPDCIIWATGELQNPEEIFTDKYLKVIKVKEENKVVNFINQENKNDKILLDKEKIKWHYKAYYVPDFAFSFSNHYLWDFMDLRVEPDRTVRINSAYNPKSDGFNKVCGIAKDAIKYFSETLPGIPFPYPSMTVFNGSGGMEFPMMVNDTKNDDFSSDVYLTSHEISHTYFPFFMGTNERKFAWMDEGWAVYLPQEFQTKYSNDIDTRERNVNRYLDYSGTLLDVPLMVQSHQLRSPSYRIAAYQKAACTYDILKDILGEELFKKTLKEYIKRWNGKHPTPYDFFNTFSNVSGQNLDWFFKPWYFEFGYPDLAISDAKIENGKLKIVIEKIGNYPVPIYINIKADNEDDIEIYESVKVWSNGVVKITFEKQFEGKIISVSLGNKYIPDFNFNNNTFNLK
jgi:hypothetical protein